MVALAAGCTAGGGSPGPTANGGPTADTSATGSPGGSPSDSFGAGGRLPSTDGAPYRDPSTPTAERVTDLLARMDVADKVGQMTQAERGQASPGDVGALRIGSVLSGGGSTPQPNTAEAWADMYDAYQQGATATLLGIPIIYGVDAVHGHNNLAGATIFPHNIGLGATRDPDLVERIARATAVEVAATGPTWTFAPCLCTARDDRWGRTYESFSEHPDVVSAMASAVTGYQGERLGAERASVLATAKHFVGDGATDGGKDQGDATLSEDELRRLHIAPFEAAIERGVGSIMVSFSSWNGEKLHAHEYLLTDVLKGELGFEGFVVSDWAGIDQIDGAPGFTLEEVAAAANAGIDMFMVPNDVELFVSLLTEAIDTGLVPMSRVDDAVSRVLTAKFELGLFERPFADRELADQIGSAEHRALAREAVARSQVLLTNDGVLPIAPGTRVVVTGSNADDVGAQSGGWTLTWQGVSGPVPGGTSILAALRAELGQAAVVHAPTALDMATTLDADVDVAIAVVGEKAYAEFEGDRPDGVTLPDGDLAVLDALEQSGIPTVVVVVSGRPLDLHGAERWAGAVVAAWLPGTEGAGVVDVLVGAVDPSGTLPMSWPRPGDPNPVNYDDTRPALFPFGAGLTSW
ncbi:MAG: beta-glucosidase [Actinomycetales bacterium]|nr:beta-glucosidase [Actinomycetales bacterium]